MVYASESSAATAGSGAAVWDIFPADATDKLNQFLRETIATKAKYSDDPILRQQFYLTTPQLANLARKYNVSPWRICQNPGDAVFIPAGCAHQVYLDDIIIHVRCVM
jgi:lysine-specific demethylase 3